MAYMGNAKQRSYRQKQSMGEYFGDLQLTTATQGSTWEKILSGVLSGVKTFLGTTMPGAPVIPAGTVAAPSTTASSMIPLLVIGGIVLLIATRKS
jgi:hypothetical protein